MEAVHAEGGLQFGEDDLVRQIVFEGKKACPGSIVAEVREIVPGHSHGPVEQGLLDRRGACHLGENAVVDFFVDPGHAHDKGGPHLLEIFQELGHIFRKGHLVPEENGGVIAHGPFQRVGERQEREEHVVAGEKIGIDGMELVDVGNEVLVGEHDALGIAGGAGGVDDGGYVVDVDGLEPLVELILVRVSAPFFHCRVQVRDARPPVSEVVEDNHLPEVGKIVLDGQHLLHVINCSRKAYDGVRVVDNVAAFLRGVGRIDGHVDRPYGENGEIRHPPLIPVGREQGDLFPRLDPFGEEIAPEVSHFFVHLVPGKVYPDALFVLKGHQRLVPVLLNPVLEDRPHRGFLECSHEYLLKKII
ncbi:MAG: hypothetical protein BWZ01_01998 [Deltaproteobacteria bacterium ADurb.BinA179]|nr:MAG: hypothetical protein BWZ01_01998 [Deltaproteobacteria bacterium ADurb.BinA179]